MVQIQGIYIQQTEDKIKTLNEQFNSALKDYQQYYILYKQSPDNQEYSNMYASINANITNLNKELFMIYNNIQIKIVSMNLENSNLNDKIINEKDQKKKLFNEYQQLNGTGNGSIEMKNNFVELYKIQYIYNWNMFLGILFIIFSLMTIFRKQGLVRNI